MPTYLNETANTITERFQNQHGSLISFAIKPGERLKTPYVLENANLTKESDSPFYNPLEAATHEVTATGAGDQTISIDLYTKAISIFNPESEIILAYINSKSNTPPLYCHGGTERLLSCGHNVEQLIFTFSAAGTIYVEERK
jgi:hypothetical protein